MRPVNTCTLFGIMYSSLKYTFQTRDLRLLFCETRPLERSAKQLLRQLHPRPGDKTSNQKVTKIPLFDNIGICSDACESSFQGMVNGDEKEQASVASAISTIEIRGEQKRVLTTAQFIHAVLLPMT